MKKFLEDYVSEQVQNCICFFFTFQVFQILSLIEPLAFVMGRAVCTVSEKHCTCNTFYLSSETVFTSSVVRIQRSLSRHPLYYSKEFSTLEKVTKHLIGYLIELGNHKFSYLKKKKCRRHLQIRMFSKIFCEHVVSTGREGTCQTACL